MLVRLRKCEKSDVDEILQQFDVLDIDNSGTLTMADISKVEETGARHRLSKKYPIESS